jgi:hypothetical protein
MMPRQNGVAIVLGSKGSITKTVTSPKRRAMKNLKTGESFKIALKDKRLDCHLLRLFY